MENKYPQYQPMRSLIYAHVIDEEYRHKMQHYLLTTHIPESVQQFQPYVTKYAFYSALPVPTDGKRFGTYNFQLTEHYWQINPLQALSAVKAFEETFYREILVWQGMMPPEVLQMGELPAMGGDDVRAFNPADMGLIPFIYAFVPVWWEEDLKGKGRTMAAGPNYRWQFMFKYPDGVSAEEGDKWFHESFVPYAQQCPEVVRMLSSKVIQEVNGCDYYRVVELWFDGPNEWYKSMVQDAGKIPAPAWIDKCAQSVFPYMAPLREFVGIFLSDYPSRDNLNPYGGFVPLR